MFEFTVTERSVARQFRARSGSISEFGGKSSNDLGETERKILAPVVETYESVFEGEINKKIDELGTMNRATKNELDRRAQKSLSFPVELKVSYEVSKKDDNGKEVKVTKYCIWKHIDSSTAPSIRWYEADSNWEKVGNGRDLKDGDDKNIKNFVELYSLLENEVKLLDEKQRQAYYDEMSDSIDFSNPYVDIIVHRYDPIEAR